MKKFLVRFNRLEVIAFVSGFVLLVFELAGARILAPGIGSSTYIWTSVIGVIIAALSVGYWLGGKVADSRGYMIDVARLTLLSALFIMVTIVQYESTIAWVAESFDDPRVQGVIASLFLFAPASLVLGMISPYLAKLNVKSLHTTGRSIASLSALNSIGGIVGTFIAGFILFGYIGSHETLALTAVAMVAVSWLATPGVEWKARLVVSIGILAIISVPHATANAISIDTPSSRYTIYEQEGVRYLATGPHAAQSGVALFAQDELVFWYARHMADIVALAPEKRNILVLGGGAFTLPRYLAEEYPNSVIDVVEIDPELADISREHFYYDDPANVNLIFADARTYVNHAEKTYDIVLVDVYGDTHVPFTLLTREYGDALARIVKPHGIVAVNMIAGLDGACRSLLGALDAPYRQHFSDTKFMVQFKDRQRTNMVATYSRDMNAWQAPTMPTIDTPTYSDDFAPAERIQHACRSQQG